jgi:TolA-binding protein
MRGALRTLCVFALLSLSVTAFGQMPSSGVRAEDEDSGSFREYSRALEAYVRKAYPVAEQRFDLIVKADRKEPETMKAHYFLARTRMKLRKWEEASAGLIRIYSIDPIFYRQWNCDFLLGEARAGMGLE